MKFQHFSQIGDSKSEDTQAYHRSYKKSTSSDVGDMSEFDMPENDLPVEAAPEKRQSSQSSKRKSEKSKKSRKSKKK